MFLDSSVNLGNVAVAKSYNFGWNYSADCDFFRGIDETWLCSVAISEPYNFFSGGTW